MKKILISVLLASYVFSMNAEGSRTKKTLPKQSANPEKLTSKEDNSRGDDDIDEYILVQTSCGLHFLKKKDYPTAMHVIAELARLQKICDEQTVAPDPEP